MKIQDRLYYFKDWRWIQRGLVQIDDGYGYVSSSLNGTMVVDELYYVASNEYGIPAGVYYFDENGRMVIPAPDPVKDGVYFENGKWYYYKNGYRCYGLGLIYVDTVWHYEDGMEYSGAGYIYVCSMGELATGEYYITNIAEGLEPIFTSGLKLIFSDLGITDAPRQGVCKVDGTLYFFSNGSVQYGGGLMEYNGGWIYVRSNGMLATGSYWITNHNDLLEEGMYIFGTDGYLISKKN